ncbi:hypothetical protein NUK43_20780, partial [Aeromonas veronii]|nr:hypothetical protein [Aeromonas veronii]
ARETRAGAKRGCLKQLCATTILKNADCAKPVDWPYSSIHRHIAAGWITPDWAIDSDSGRE